MHEQTESPTQRVMDRIDDERRRDELLRKVSKVAWAVTLVIVLILVGLTAAQIANMMPLLKFQAGGGPIVAAVIGMALPLVFVLGALAVLVATLSTIGMFMRARAASLHEIQLRLASLEEMVIASSAAREQR